MKKTCTLITATVLCFSFFTSAGQARLSIGSMSQYALKVVIDGRNYNNGNIAQNNIVVNDIAPGYHFIKIYQQKNNRNNRGRYSSNSLQLIYNANIYVKQQFHVDISINRFGKAFVDEKQINSGYYSDDDDETYLSWNDNYYLQAMNGRAFDQLIKTISNEGFDNTKLTIAKQAVEGNYFSAAQVKEIVMLFSFESSKLDIAKYYYSHCTEKQNYFIVNDAFGFSSSKDDLVKYVQAAK